MIKFGRHLLVSKGLIEQGVVTIICQSMVDVGFVLLFSMPVHIIASYKKEICPQGLPDVGPHVHETCTIVKIEQRHKNAVWGI